MNVTPDISARTCLLTAKTAREDLPGIFRSKGNLRLGCRIFAYEQAPGRMLATYDPMATCGAQNCELQGYSRRRIDIAKRMRQGSYEGVDCRRKENRLVKTCAADGVPDLLLMMPPLGVLASQIQPDGCGLRSCPANGLTNREGVERGEIGLHLWTEVGKQIAEELWTHSARGFDPGTIQLIDEGDEIFPTRDGSASWRKHVSTTRKVSDIATEEMQGDILNGPLPGRGRECPFIWTE